jgi:hypothetical protein
MQSVIRRLASPAAALVIAPFLTFASALAPQHIHEPEPGHGHDHPLAHSHFAPHDADHHHDNSVTEIEHDEAHHGQIVWTNSPILHKTAYRAANVLPAIPASNAGVQVELHWSVTPFDAAAPAHGPPRAAHRLRGPPTPRLN